MDLGDFPILTVLILIPVATVLAIAVLPATDRRAIRVAALGGTVITFVASLLLLVGFEVGEAGFQFGETRTWIPDYGVTYRLGLDGVSLFLVLLTTLFMPLAVLAAWEQEDRAKGFFAALIGLEAALIGVFVALDLLLFYVFFEIMLVPMYGLIGIWGSEQRRYAAIKFFMFTLVGGLFMLVGILYLYFAAGAESFDYTFVLENAALTGSAQLLLFGAFFIAFAIKVPLFPVHTWLPDAHTEAPTVGSVILAAVMLKIGGYGFLRYSLPYFPQATQDLAPAVLTLAVIGVLYGALVAAMQRDVKRLVAYSSVSHLGFVVLGTFAIETTAAAGSVVQMINHGLSTGALFLLVGFMYERTHSRAISAHSGLLKAAPVFGGLFLFVTMSSIALPGLNGFVGEFPILLGSFRTVPWAAGLAVFGVIFAALYLLWAYQRMFHGPVEGRANTMTDLVPRELLVIAPLIVLMLVIGLYPKPLYDRVNPSVEQIVSGVQDATVADIDEQDQS
ncbi:MAG: NADH-quinone oxidoreductase subunit M [Nitriliruptorales bacterium]|nr:NADH-quinone oxidoreductase subunit M [Nitriliruptorales bacterium]